MATLAAVGRYHPARVVLNTFVRWRTLEHKYAGKALLNAFIVVVVVCALLHAA